MWRSHDPAIDKLVRPFLQAETPVHRQAVRVQVVAHEGGPLWTVWTLVARPDIQITVQSPEPLVAAQHRALDEVLPTLSLARLGGTTYDLVDLDLDVSGNPFAPASLLNSPAPGRGGPIGGDPSPTAPIGYRRSLCNLGRSAVYPSTNQT